MHGTPLLKASAGTDEHFICRHAAVLGDGNMPPSQFMVLPAGTHAVNGSLNGEMQAINVQVNPDTARVLQAALDRHLSRSEHKPYFDFDHEEKQASAWPIRFFWQSGAESGVYAEVEWSRAGAEAIEGKSHRAFSISCLLDRTQTNGDEAARVVGAPFVMGGLVNDPAFRKLSPLWASRVGRDQGACGAGRQPAAGQSASGAGQSANSDLQTANSNNDQDTMTKEQLAALQAAHTQLETDVKNLTSEVAALKAANKDDEAATLQARQADLRVKQAQLETSEANLKAAEAEARATEAENTLQAQRTAKAEAAIQAAIERGVFPAQPAADSPEAQLMARYRGLIEEDEGNIVLLDKLPGKDGLKARQLTQGKVEVTGEDVKSALKAYNVEADAKQRGLLYARAIRKTMQSEEGALYVLEAANSLGTLSGTLVVQRALDLLKIEFPALRRISTDFSGEQAKLNQTISTRLRTVPTPGTYHVTNGYVSQDAGTTDVDVTIDAHKFVQHTFNANEMASTARLLFGEQEEVMHYAIGLELMDALYALLVVANFDETDTTEALVDFDRTTVINLGIAMQSGSAGRNANIGTRTLLLNPAYYGKLAEDTIVVSNLNNPGASNAIGSGVLPMVHGFLPVEAPNLPTTANLTGFGMRADAVAMAVRPANDYAQAIPGLPSTGVVQQVTNPDTGLTVSLVQFVDHQLGHTSMRLAWMRGVAKGNPKAGQILNSA